MLPAHARAHTEPLFLFLTLTVTHICPRNRTSNGSMYFLLVAPHLSVNAPLCVWN